MNLYIIVEGVRTEPMVYTAWLSLLAPQLQKVDDARKAQTNNYYLFSAGGIPSIYSHISNAVADINDINSGGKGHYDYLMVCLDTEGDALTQLEKRINEQLTKDKRELKDAQLVLFEQNICMETWFLGNRNVFKSNPQEEEFIRYISHYNVRDNDPELMGNIENGNFSTTAQFHCRYLQVMFKERNMKYSKTGPTAVCEKSYLDQLIKRYEETKHIPSFGRWLNFITHEISGGNT